MRTDMCVDMCVDMCKGMRVDMSADMRMDMHADMLAVGDADMKQQAPTPLKAAQAHVPAVDTRMWQE